MRVRITVFAVGILCQAAFAAAKVDFSRYEVILARKPFGEPPAEAAPAPAATAATSFIKDIRMSLLTEHPEFGIRVGFVDLAAKKNYFLSVGDTEDGIQVVDADYEKEAAKLQKGADAFWINMTGQVNPGSGGPVEIPSAAAGAPAGSVVASAMPKPTVPLERMSYAERVRLRREAFENRQKQRAESAAIAATNVPAAEKAAALRELQMNLIRAGGAKGPALPMPLTKEMDDQLVAEGVLPPVGESGTETAGNAEPVEAAPAPVSQ
jgi:hypothetical protein